MAGLPRLLDQIEDLMPRGDDVAAELEAFLRDQDQRRPPWPLPPTGAEAPNEGPADPGAEPNKE